MASPSTVADVFDRAANTYDNVGVPYFGPIAAGLVEHLAPQPGECVLDVGCGRGAVLQFLANAVGPTGSAVGIDLAPRMVEHTARDLADLPQVTVRICDARDPDLPVESYDVVASSLVLFFLPDPVLALRNWARLLVSGGRLGITTFGPQDERWVKVDEVFTRYLPPALLDARTSGRRGPFGSDEGVEQLFRDVGLLDVRTAHRAVEVVFADADHLVDFSWSHGQRAMWEAVPEDRRAAVAAHIRAAAQEFADGSGRIAFTQQARYTLGRRG